MPKAKAVVAAIRGGEDFEEAMKAYNEDSSTEEQMLRGYPVAAESQLYGEEFSSGRDGSGERRRCFRYHHDGLRLLYPPICQGSDRGRSGL